MHRSLQERSSALPAIIVLAVWVLSGASAVSTEQKAGALRQQVQGNWTLVAVVNEQDGKRIGVFGPGPGGSLILTPDGRFSFIILRASLPKFASRNRITGADKENEAVVPGPVAYFGTYAVPNGKEQTVQLTIEGSTFPHGDGEVQKRIMTVTGDELKLTDPTSAVGGTNALIWKRAN
jgi:Lipocalin-like domain